jgi:alkanesulfonate monooxygenase SsuD/methylene tetrahydromethanopterin reductase-like flavin-dependent oxidoreductase (luciferase family)
VSDRAIKVGLFRPGVEGAMAGATGYPRGFPGWHHNPIQGSPEQIAESLQAFARAGIAHVQIWLDPATPAGVEALAPVLPHLDRP